MLTRDQDLSGEGFVVANSVEAALNAAGNVPEIMIIGGAGVYKEFLPLVNRIYLSIIPKEIEGDAFFPELDTTKWHVVAQEEHPKFLVQIFEH